MYGMSTYSLYLPIQTDDYETPMDVDQSSSDAYSMNINRTTVASIPPSSAILGTQPTVQTATGPTSTGTPLCQPYYSSSILSQILTTGSIDDAVRAAPNPVPIIPMDVDLNHPLSAPSSISRP
jgi:hypothetical protein